ncbi:MAG: cytochrome P450 [Actinobacteria bacterium]|nr:cytochrome P450 [Actinomycetota bacterium]
MTDENRQTIATEELADEFRHLSCYTTPPARTLELFAAGRGRCPVAHSDEHDGFELLLAYDDVRKGMADHELYSSEPQVLRPMLPRKPIPALEMDPPVHQHWRALFNQAVTPRTTEMMEPLVRADINHHIDAFVGRGSAELIDELAEPVPAEAICHLVGVDAALVPTVRELAIQMFAAMGEPEEFGRRQAEFGKVTVGEIHKRQSEPRDDFLTYLANVEVEGRKLDDDDYVVLLAAFLGAGHHSTTSAMSSLIFEVFGTPGRREELAADPTAIPTAVEEALRLHPPFYGFFRRTTEATEVEGVEIPKGCDVYMAWASANRDPEVFPDPTEFRLDRGRNRHLTFGFGVHTCPGAALARMELRVVIEELLRRLPDLKVGIDEPEYEFGGGDYAFMKELPVSFEPRAAEAAAP